MPDKKAEQWYKSAVFYELSVRTFMDSSGDGKGDFAGLSSKLDYIKELGIDVIWVLPCYPSPLHDDGYDVASYTEIHPDLGTLDDFKFFLAQAHAKGLKVITDLVINHTSDQHMWFKEARKGKLLEDGSPNPYHDYYVWSDTGTEYSSVRIIFSDTEKSNWSKDDICGRYFWHRFFSHQPDLNYDNPKVEEEILAAARFWLDLGVDGYRVDAAPYLIEREGTNCENLPKTHEFIKKLRQLVDTEYPDKVLLAEANQWPEEVAEYFGTELEPEFHMCFNFPVMPRLYLSLAQENTSSIREIMERMPSIPNFGQWATFLRNHDELTLEMVTENERDLMYEHYAPEPDMRMNVGIRRRLAPLLGNSHPRIKLLSSVLLTLPGSPILYYGDEIGMGDNISLSDRNGVRTPMQWDSSKNGGFSTAEPSSCFFPPIHDSSYGYDLVNVSGQLADKGSLLNWTKNILLLRKSLKCLDTGSIDFIETGNPALLAFKRSSGEGNLLVIANFSPKPQSGDLHELIHAPNVIYGKNESITELSTNTFLLRLEGYSFIWATF